MSERIYFLALLVTCFWHSLSSYSLRNCQIFNVTNGRVKYTGSGHIIRFTCNPSYVLVGSSSAICDHGQWSNPKPFCAQTDCPLPGRILHGSISFGNQRATAIPSCDPDFSLFGSPLLLCTENGWNDTLPTCQVNSLQQFGTCHFEPKESIQCNWILKPALYKWTLVSSGDHNSSDMGHYPGFDHTLGPHTGGHYLFLDNAMPVSAISLRLEERPDNGAKYISPLFPPVDDADEWCLIFFIYSYGPNAGNVKVTINNDTVWDNTESLRRNMWTRVSISLVHQRSSPFRIIIIGKGRIGQFSNTAIDDLRIAHGPDCSNNHDDVLPYAVEPASDEDGKELTSSSKEDSDNHNLMSSSTNPSTTEVISSSTNPSTTEIISSSTSYSVTSQDPSHFSESLMHSTSEEENSSANSSPVPTSSSDSSSSASNFSYPSTTTAYSSESYDDNYSVSEFKEITTSKYLKHKLKVRTDPVLSKTPESLSSWTDLEKSMVYLVIVTVSTLVLIISLAIIRYRNYHTFKITNKKCDAQHQESIAFLDAVEMRYR